MEVRVDLTNLERGGFRVNGFSMEGFVIEFRTFLKNYTLLKVGWGKLGILECWGPKKAD